MKYTFDSFSTLDNNLSIAWEEWDEYNEFRSRANWLDFLESLPGVDNAEFTDGPHGEIFAETTLTFNDGSELSLFLLKWS